MNVALYQLLIVPPVLHYKLSHFFDILVGEDLDFSLANHWVFHVGSQFERNFSFMLSLRNALYIACFRVHTHE